LTDNLAAKLLISINILVPEKVDIIISKKARYIRSCKIDIKLKATLKKGIAKLLVCVIAKITIPLFASIAILIYYIAIAKDKNLLFKPDNTLVTLFV
jgi:MoaA/NifB/PqqE/SkfB family radical SAM enzyme